MTDFNYSYNSQYAPPSAFYFRDPEADLNRQKRLQKKSLRSTSNKLGFFVTVYLVTMYLLSFIFVLAMGSKMDYNNEYQLFLINVAVAVGASLIPGMIFMFALKGRVSDVLTHTHVKPSLMFPLVMFGLSTAMLANIAASMFDNNISLFQLENYGNPTAEGQTLEAFIYSVIGTAIVPAFAEEFAFRGIILSHFRKYGDAFAIFASALLFGCMHGNTTQIVFAFLLGLIFAFIDVKTNSIIPSVIVHFLNNLYAVISNTLQSHPALTDQQSSFITTAIVVMICTIGILSLIYLAKTKKDFFRVSDSTPLCSLLSFKEKIGALFSNPGVIIAMSLFLIETIYNLFPQ